MDYADPDPFPEEETKHFVILKLIEICHYIYKRFGLWEILMKIFLF